MRDYVYICDNAYSREQIVQMEQLVLAKLGFRLTVPTQRSFLKRFCKAAQVSDHTIRAFLWLATA